VQAIVILLDVGSVSAAGQIALVSVDLVATQVSSTGLAEDEEVTGSRRDLISSVSATETMVVFHLICFFHSFSSISSLFVIGCCLVSIVSDESEAPCHCRGLFLVLFRRCQFPRVQLSARNAISCLSAGLD
jgi:hypothetical protein